MSQWFRFGGLRSSPLNAALCKAGKIGIILFIRSLHPSVYILVKTHFSVPILCQISRKTCQGS
ncbi:hypothetical protein [Vibrio scophthalmi]|uniref:hypothetical protein n=1 Tax=Vibrio scophthalmi TaxID=45658 RepID=UPI000B2E0A4E|nr:hypothetical protein [Vibrio scophthalmi]